jgi:hypothetical protein
VFADRPGVTVGLWSGSTGLHSVVLAHMAGEVAPVFSGEIGSGV